jgi:hypothetical protein
MYKVAEKDPTTQLGISILQQLVAEAVKFLRMSVL